MLRPSPWFIWLILAIFSITANTRPAQQPKPRFLTDLTENGPLSHALIYARRANDQFHVSEIAVHYAKLGDFEQALRVNESATEEDWRTGAFSTIALEYWNQGQPGKAHELFIRVASLPLPKDTIYIWGDVIEEMAQAELFDLALDTTAAMAAAGGSTAGAELARVVNIIPLVENLESNEQTPQILKNFAVAFAKAGNVRTAIQQIPRINQPFYITEALIEIGLLCATKKLTLAEADVALLDELAIGDLPTGIEPERLVNEALHKKSFSRGYAA